MSVFPGRGGRREPAIRSSMYCAGTATASANSSGDRLISRRRRRSSSPTVAGGFNGGDEVMNGACEARLLREGVHQNNDGTGAVARSRPGVLLSDTPPGVSSTRER